MYIGHERVIYFLTSTLKKKNIIFIHEVHQFQTGLDRVILSVLDPRKCEYLKDYSLDFEHAYMTTYLAS